MKLDFVVLAEAVSLAGDKLYLHGAPLKRLDVPQLPWAVPMGIGLSFTADLEEAGNAHELQFRMTGPAEGTETLAAPPFPLQLPQRDQLPPDFERISALTAIGLGIVGFSYEGWYTIELALDSEPLASLEVRVVLNPELRQRMIYSEAKTPD